MKFFRIFFAFALIVSFIGCAEKVQVVSKPKPVVQPNIMTQAVLARIISTNVDVRKLMASPLRKAVSLPAQYPSVESWISHAKEAEKIRDSKDKSAITVLIHLNLSGIAFSSNKVWNPDQIILRGQFAKALLDIATRLTNNKAMKTEFKGQRSPFPDIVEGDSLFDAVMAVASRGLLAAANKKSGKFIPNGMVSLDVAQRAFERLKTLY